MRLLGAKEFLKTVKPGTLCIEFWSNKQECHELIRNYEAGKTIDELLEKFYGEFYMFGDNAGSLAFIESDDIVGEYEEYEIEGITYNCLFYYDKNIVGDASPTETLQLVFDNEDEWPNEVRVEKSTWKEGESRFAKPLHKEDLKRIQKWFLEDNNLLDETGPDAWALKALEENDYYRDDSIVNYKSR